MSGSIILSPKFGVNPALTICPLCLGESNELVMLGKKPRKFFLDHGYSHSEIDGDALDASVRRVVGSSRCHKCEEITKTHIAFIKATTNSNGEVVRSGLIIFVKEEVVKNIISHPDLLKSALASRATFVDAEAWTRIGLDDIEKRAMENLEKPESEIEGE